MIFSGLSHCLSQRTEKGEPGAVLEGWRVAITLPDHSSSSKTVQ